MSAEVEDILGDGGRQPKSASGILRIHDHEVDLALLDDMRQMLPDDPPSRSSENVSDKEHFHRDSCLP
jgi:hypothetical protein